MPSLTKVEERLDRRARRFLGGARGEGLGGARGGGPGSRLRRGLTEFGAFGLKQAWACIFGAALLAVILAARLWYPDDAALARNDFLTLAAVAIQAIMVATRLETLKELRVIVLFHLVGTVMELFKTDVG